MSKTLKVYTLKELKEQFPEGFKSAHADYIAEFQELGEIPWNDELMDSLKAAVRALGYTLKDWSIGPYDRCSLKIDERDCDNFTGIRSLGYIYKAIGGKQNLNGCNLTGFCADDDFINELISDAKSGMRLRDSVMSLADKAGKLMEAECEYAESEDGFLNSWMMDDYFTASGHRVDSSEVDRSDNSIDASLVPDEE